MIGTQACKHQRLSQELVTLTVASVEAPKLGLSVGPVITVQRFYFLLLCLSRSAAAFQLATSSGISLLGKSSLVFWNPLF